MKIPIFKIASLSLVVTASVLASWLFVFGSYTLFPTVDRADWEGVPADQRAKWFKERTVEVRGVDYAEFVVSDSELRYTLTVAGLLLFGFGFVCGIGGAKLQSRQGVA